MSSDLGGTPLFRERVLVVEDDKAIRALISTTLERQEVEPVLVSTGRAALAEAAVYGSSCAVSSSGNGVEEATGRLQGRGDYFSVSGSKREITAGFSHTIRIPFWNLRWQQTETLKSKVIRPVLFIEKVEKARNLIQSAKDP